MDTFSEHTTHPGFIAHFLVDFVKGEVYQKQKQGGGDRLVLLGSSERIARGDYLLVDFTGRFKDGVPGRSDYKSWHKMHKHHLGPKFVPPFFFGIEHGACGSQLLRLDDDENDDDADDDADDGGDDDDAMWEQEFKKAFD